MKTKSGYETDGTYLKFKSGFTSYWYVETADKIELFATEEQADEYISELKGYGKGDVPLPKDFVEMKNIDLNLDETTKRAIESLKNAKNLMEEQLKLLEIPKEYFRAT